jgi:hypothetical protein
MEKLFVPYEIALKLKEKGFDNEQCFAVYYRVDNDVRFEYDLRGSQYEAKKGWSSGILAPMYQQVVDFFREKHNLDVNVSSWKERNEVVYLHTAHKLGIASTYHLDFQPKDYYQSLNRGIEEAITLISIK